MNKRIIFILLFIFMLNITLALTITEIESNPEGSDAENEWIEFYTNEEINISEYRITNNDGIEILLNWSFSKGYNLYSLKKQWLDNSDEKIILYKNNEKIQESILIEDSKNNNKTWQLCDNLWLFLENTKNKENNCIKEENKSVQNTTINNNQNIITSNNISENLNKQENKNIKTTKEKTIEKEINEFKENTELKQEQVEIKTIKLTPKTIKTGKISENLDYSKKQISKKYAEIIFGIFFVSIILLLIIQNRSLKKNEFR